MLLCVEEDKTIRVWDMPEGPSIRVFRRDDRFWTLTDRTELNLFVAVHDGRLMVFRFEHERPAFAVRRDTLYCIHDKYMRQLGRAGYTAFSLTAIFESEDDQVQTVWKTLGYIFPKNATSLVEAGDSSTDGKRSATTAIYVAHARSCLAVLTHDCAGMAAYPDVVSRIALRAHIRD
ncbi:hypothetical protein AURDEDRAFT_168925 [Auricularia subglabra TFB-10046 SS5]|nr:hypothetical protein AURDEDRAFT_168925 [Auricularia subglabra TFB-10046 SS5]